VPLSHRVSGGGIPSKCVNTDGIFLDAVTARDQPDDTADVAADVIDFVYGESIFDVPADQLILTQVYDLQIIRIVGFEIMLGPGSGTVQSILQLAGNLYADEQPLATFQFRVSS
jgi:hypothetical protein